MLGDHRVQPEKSEPPVERGIATLVTRAVESLQGLRGFAPV